VTARPPADPRLRAALDAFAHALAVEVLREIQSARHLVAADGPKSPAARRASRERGAPERR